MFSFYSRSTYRTSALDARRAIAAQTYVSAGQQNYFQIIRRTDDAVSVGRITLNARDALRQFCPKFFRFYSSFGQLVQELLQLSATLERSNHSSHQPQSFAHEHTEKQSIKKLHFVKTIELCNFINWIDGIDRIDQINRIYWNLPNSSKLLRTRW